VHPGSGHTKSGRILASLKGNAKPSVAERECRAQSRMSSVKGNGGRSLDLGESTQKFLLYSEFDGKPLRGLSKHVSQTGFHI
jgi:hypothetical protein